MNTLLIIVIVALLVFAALAWFLLSRLDIDPKVKMLFVLLFVSLTSVILLALCLVGYLHQPPVTSLNYSGVEQVLNNEPIKSAISYYSN